MKVERSRSVESDLETIGDYIALDNPTRAVSFIRELRDLIGALGENPYLYRLRPDFGRDARVAPMGRYVIIFRVVDQVVRIERVLHGGRDLPRVYQGK